LGGQASNSQRHRRATTFPSNTEQIATAYGCRVEKGWLGLGAVVFPTLVDLPIFSMLPPVRQLTKAGHATSTAQRSH
jgi:hypothetical protein